MALLKGVRMRLVKRSSLVLAVGLAWGLSAGVALAQVEQAHLRIDGMT